MDFAQRIHYPLLFIFGLSLFYKNIANMQMSSKLNCTWSDRRGLKAFVTISESSLTMFLLLSSVYRCKGVGVGNMTRNALCKSQHESQLSTERTDCVAAAGMHAGHFVEQC